MTGDDKLKLEIEVGDRMIKLKTDKGWLDSEHQFCIQAGGKFQNIGG